MKRQGSFTQYAPVKSKKPALKRQDATVGVVKGRSNLLFNEQKYHDVSISADATTAGTILQLSSIPQGDTALTRDGNKVVIKSAEIRLKLSLEAITANAVVRIMLVLDKQANAVAMPSITTYLLTAITPDAVRAIGFLDRFTVLMDKTCVINQTASNAGGFQKEFIKKWVNLPNIVTSFLDSSTGIPTTNGLSLVYFSDLSTGVADVDMAGTVRLRFVG